MKTPTTITVIAWNYCQNRCSYCVSESNKSEWKLNGRDEIWKPEGEEDLNFYQLADKYGLDYHEKMCPEPDKYLKAKDVLDYKYAIEWIKKYRPGAHVHISGGEPLLRPDIEDMVEAFSKEFETTIVTNGQLISERPRLLDLPVKWLVTYHIGQVRGKDLKENNLILIKDKSHLITAVIEDNKEYNPDIDLAEFFSEYNFEYKKDARKYSNKNFEYNPEDLNDIASHRIMLIQPNGPVVGCNKPHRGKWDRYQSESNIYTMICNEKYLAVNNNRAYRCVTNNRCSAYQTARKMFLLGD